MKKVLQLVLLGMISMGLVTSTVYAGEVDVLVNLLVEKGILTPVEAQIVKDETKKIVAQEIAEGKSSSLPKWVQNMKLKGDLRIRHQYERKTSDTEGRNRGRIRYRLGVESKVTDQVKVGAGLSSGGDDPRSTNQTLQNTFSTPDIRLDYAFAEYKHNKNLKLIAGKFKRKPYLWAPTDLLWDGDINPEGGSVRWEDDLFDNTDYFVNSGIWILDDNDQVDLPDPYLKYVQTGLKFKEGQFDAKLANTFYAFEGIKDKRTLDNSSGTNTLNAASDALQSDYTTIATSAEFGVKKLFGGLPFNIDERIAFFGDFVHNVDDDIVKDGRTGLAFGMKLGNKKVKKPGNWQLKYIKAKLGKDAWLDTFPDSDRFGGKTDIESHEVAFNYALRKNVIFGVDYYKSWSMSDPDDIEHLVQADLLFKF